MSAQDIYLERCERGTEGTHPGIPRSNNRRWRGKDMVPTELIPSPAAVLLHSEATTWNLTELIRIPPLQCVRASRTWNRRNSCVSRPPHVTDVKRAWNLTELIPGVRHRG